MPEKGWQRRFDDPIPRPRGRELVTLEDAGTYITKLPNTPSPLLRTARRSRASTAAETAPFLVTDRDS
jgi:hypothetical protein